MVTDDLFSIQFVSQLKGESAKSRSIPASDFFDPTYLQSHDTASLNCMTPWKHDDLRDYVIAGESDHYCQVEWLQLDIVDRRTQEQRRIMQQEWGDNWISVDWNRSSVSEPNCVLILRIKEASGQAWQVLKVHLPFMGFALRGHSVYFGGTPFNPNSIEYVEGYDRRR